MPVSQNLRGHFTKHIYLNVTLPALTYYIL